MSTLKNIDGIATRGNAGFQIGQWGSDCFVLNTDTKTAESAPLDPMAVNADSTLSTKVYLIPVSAGSWAYLDLWHIYTGSDPVTALYARAFGLVGMAVSPPTGNRLLPYDIDSGNWTPLTTTNPGIWIPLSDPASGDVQLRFSVTPAIDTGGSINPVYSLSPKRTVALNGVGAVQVTVEQAADTITKGMMLGRFLAA